MILPWRHGVGLLLSCRSACLYWRCFSIGRIFHPDLHLGWRAGKCHGIPPRTQPAQSHRPGARCGVDWSVHWQHCEYLGAAGDSLRVAPGIGEFPWVYSERAAGDSLRVPPGIGEFPWVYSESWRLYCFSSITGSMTSFFLYSVHRSLGKWGW